jgi:hypothetical protein
MKKAVKSNQLDYTYQTWDNRSAITDSYKTPIKKVGFKLLKNCTKRSATNFKRTYIKIPQNKSVTYDCILDEARTVEVPEIQEDVLNRYAARESSFLNLIKFYF